MDDLKRWWATVPFLNKSLITVCILIFFLDWLVFKGFLSYYAVNMPILTIENFHVWAPFTTWLIHTSFIDLLFSLWMVYYDGILIEKRIGTAHYFIELLIKNIMISVSNCRRRVGSQTQFLVPRLNLKIFGDQF